MPVVTTENHVEFPRGGVFEEIVQLGVDVGLHEARSWVVETATRAGRGADIRGGEPATYDRARSGTVTEGSR
ncbi:hypothetical protein Skr01_17290 [Sphaerisporangium krabiense]|nr:hypothetical protein Skr01_17290 [Sphaerisporangium krabiense]